MTVLHESFTVNRPIAEVFDYISDFSTTQEWDATAIRARKLTAGAIAVGTQFEVVCALPVGSITLWYEVIGYDRNRLFELRGHSHFFDITDTITITETEGVTRIEYRAQFFFKPYVRGLAERSKRGLEDMGRESVQGLAEALENNYPAPTSSEKYELADKWVLPGLSLFTSLGYKQASKHFKPMSASVQGKHVLITGASSGLGFVAARELARRGAKLTLVMRASDSAKQAVLKLRNETGNPAIYHIPTDLSLLAEVDALAAQLLASNEAIDIIINNAGALFSSKTHTTEGLEKSHVLLLLSPARLTESLKPLLLKAAAPRVINVVSGGMYSQQLDVATLSGTTGSYSGSAAYARQKRALMVLTQQWAKRWEQQGIVVNAMHPGWVDTPGVQRSLPRFRSISRAVLRSPDQGADTIVWLAVATEAAKVSGELFLDRQIHSAHLLERTRESGEERRKLALYLEQFLPSFRAAEA